jgi:hypothetical protein
MELTACGEDSRQPLTLKPARENQPMEPNRGKRESRPTNAQAREIPRRGTSSSRFPLTGGRREAAQLVYSLLEAGCRVGESLIQGDDRPELID